MTISVQEAQIGAIYVGYFGRSADPPGLAYWVGQLNNGVPLVSIAQSFSVQPEATALYPFLSHPTVDDAADFMISVYSNLFSRQFDGTGLTWWLLQLYLGKPVGRVIVDMISGAQGTDLQTITNKITIAVEYAQAFDGAHKTWTPSDLASSRSVLSGVTSDPASVTAAEAKIHDIVHPTLALPASTMGLTVAGNTVMLNGTDGTITLTGADLAAYPAAKYGTVDKAVSAGIDSVHAMAGATLDASGNSAATTFDFGAGAVGAADTREGGWGRVFQLRFLKRQSAGQGDCAAAGTGNLPRTGVARD